jgi:oligoribonuclease (3'-5' exoribonuclease)
VFSTDTNWGPTPRDDGIECIVCSCRFFPDEPVESPICGDCWKTKNERKILSNYKADAVHAFVDALLDFSAALMELAYSEIPSVSEQEAHDALDATTRKIAELAAELRSGR